MTTAHGSSTDVLAPISEQFMANVAELGAMNLNSDSYDTKEPAPNETFVNTVDETENKYENEDNVHSSAGSINPEPNPAAAQPPRISMKNHAISQISNADFNVGTPTHTQNKSLAHRTDTIELGLQSETQLAPLEEITVDKMAKDTSTMSSKPTIIDETVIVSLKRDIYMTWVILKIHENMDDYFYDNKYIFWIIFTYLLQLSTYGFLMVEMLLHPKWSGFSKDLDWTALPPKICALIVASVYILSDLSGQFQLIWCRNWVKEFQKPGIKKFITIYFLAFIPIYVMAAMLTIGLVATAEFGMYCIVYFIILHIL